MGVFLYGFCYLLYSVALGTEAVYKLSKYLRICG